jgi:osmotically-inducible protein OsmY
MITPKELTGRAISLGFGTVRTAAGLGGKVVSGAIERIDGGSRRAPAPKDLDDVTLSRKVESVAFRGSGASLRNVTVTAVSGRVELRGTVPSRKAITELEARVRTVPEVLEVDNQVTTSPARRKPARTAKKNPPAPKPKAKTDDQTEAVVSEAEPTGKELAEEGKGRQPAPLGATDPDDASTPGEKVEAELDKGERPGTGRDTPPVSPQTPPVSPPA